MPILAKLLPGALKGTSIHARHCNDWEARQTNKENLAAYVTRVLVLVIADEQKTGLPDNDSDRLGVTGHSQNNNVSGSSGLQVLTSGLLVCNSSSS